MDEEKQKRHFAGKKSHGVHIPPRKKQSGRNITLEFVLTGTVPSKKNLQVPTFNRQRAVRKVHSLLYAVGSDTLEDRKEAIRQAVDDIRCYIHNSGRYTKWVSVQKPVIAQQVQALNRRYKAHGLAYPITRCSISIVFYWADDRARDNSNKAETIQDLLVSCGIIADDNYRCLFKTVTEAENYKGEINEHIAQIFITAYDW